MQIQISWLLQKPTDLDLHCLQKQDISGLSRTRDGYVTLIAELAFYSSCHQHSFFSFDWFLIKLAEKVDMDKVPRGAVNWREHGCLLFVCLYMHHSSLYMVLDC